ncbi:FGGY carbohydrate kinase domain-containing protein [Biomphalaria glabrata]|nr:FGGY carbohydrate kinase domain-containing protein-like [Biomphalaria glabrata]KAI8773147.1 FGGY carbohydrate kinase domain-containing protein [Biomphalaria glabrata]
MKRYFIGVDIGTSSVRASIVGEDGQLLSLSTSLIKIWNPKPDFYQQSSHDIWKNITNAVKVAVSKASVQPIEICGIGFDATCSLVVLNKEMQPLTVSLDGEAEQNIIMWMDHRAQSQADLINATQHSVLNTVGGVMSLEMQPPKLLWLKQNLPDTWQNIGHLFDLPDFLTWRATGCLTRSLCSLVCKWGYQADASSMSWDDEFLACIGLSDLSHDEHSVIGNKVNNPGSPCGAGLSAEAAKELGLLAGTPVAASMIDAHAGALGCLGCKPREPSWQCNLENILVMIAGTSTCHIICSKKPIPVPGVWGPYYSVILPEMWVNEGGQSAAGHLIEFLITNHKAYSLVKEEANKSAQDVYEYLNTYLQKIADQRNIEHLAKLTHDFQIWPDFHGNRSPLADASLKGMISGLTLSNSADDLAVLYLAAVQSLAYGTKHIVSEMKNCGHKISLVYICGGLAKNSLYVQTHADVLGLPVVLPNAEQSILLGSAMLGACASGHFPNLQAALASMGGQGTVLSANQNISSFHEKKFQVFLAMVQDQKKYQSIMSSV